MEVKQNQIIRQEYCEDIEALREAMSEFFPNMDSQGAFIRGPIIFTLSIPDKEIRTYEFEVRR